MGVATAYERVVAHLTRALGDRIFVSSLDTKIDQTFEEWAARSVNVPNDLQYVWASVQQLQNAPAYDDWIRDSFSPVDGRVRRLKIYDRNGGEVPRTTIEPNQKQTELAPSSEQFSPDYGLLFASIDVTRVNSSVTIGCSSIGQLTVGDTRKLILRDCQIGTLHILPNAQCEVLIERCHIGTFRGDSSSILSLLLNNVRIHHFILTPPGMNGPEAAIHGSVFLDRCTFPARVSKFHADRSHGYTVFRSYLEQLDDAHAAHQFRGIEGATQFYLERGLFKFITGLHGIVSRFGLSPFRPVTIAFVIWLGISGLVFFFDDVKISLESSELAKFCDGYPYRASVSEDLAWRTGLCGNSIHARIFRASLLPAQHLINPLGILPRTDLLEARSIEANALLMAQDMITVILYFYLFFAIRRRFRM